MWREEGVGKGKFKKDRLRSEEGKVGGEGINEGVWMDERRSGEGKSGINGRGN